MVLSLFFLVDSPYRSQTLHDTYLYDVTVTRRENEGFGFVIISSVTKSGSTIGKTEIKLDRIPRSALQANSLVKIHFVCIGPPATYSVAYCVAGRVRFEIHCLEFIELEHVRFNIMCGIFRC